MTNLITLTIPNDDHIALRAFGKALEEMALAHGAPLRVNPHVDVEKLRETMENAEPTYIVPEVDTTAQQVESLGATHIVTEQKLVGDPEPVGDGNFSQGYIATVEEIADPVDSTGTPWDERIHSTSKALNADGTWRLRRKPKDMGEEEWAALVESIKNELQYREQLKEETEHSFSDSEFVVDPYDTYEEEELPSVTPPGDDFHTDAGVVTEQTVAGIPPIPVPPPVVVAPPVPVQAALSEGIARYGDAMSELAKNDADVQWDFPRIMTFLTERHGKIDVATVNTLLAQDGMSSVQELNAHPDKIGPFVARVKAHLGE